MISYKLLCLHPNGKEMNSVMVRPKKSESRISPDLRPFLYVLLGGTCDEVLSDSFETIQPAEGARLESQRRHPLPKTPELLAKRTNVYMLSRIHRQGQ
jgi:hypothetical protein